MTRAVGRDYHALQKLDVTEASHGGYFYEPQNMIENVYMPYADVSFAGMASFNPVTRDCDHVLVHDLRKIYKVFDDSLHGDLAKIRSIKRAVGQPSGDDSFELTIVSRSQSDSVWVVKFVFDVGPIEYWSYDRGSQRSTFLAYDRPVLNNYKFVPMSGFRIEARDGLELPCYLLLPDKAYGRKPYPLVVWVHGGPWFRNEWGFDSTMQWYANRGFAVLSIQYRGSSGFGKVFEQMGDRQWYHSMQDDLIDGARWAVSKGIADESKLVIAGRSYGGYLLIVLFQRETFFISTN